MAVTIAVPPATDPAYLAFLRQSGVAESELKGEAALRISMLNRGLNRRLPGYAEDKKYAIQDTADDWENRGLYASGARRVAQTRAASQINRRKVEDAADTADSVTNISTGTAAEIARLRRQMAEKELETRYNIGTTLQPTHMGGAA